MKKILVIGLGSFGFYLAQELAKKKCEVVALDNARGKIQDIKDLVTHAIVGNAADKDVLSEIGVKDFDMVCVCIGEQTATSILLTNYLKEIGVKRIMAKAADDDHARVLHLVGATDVIFPEKDEAVRFASTVLNPDILDTIRLSELYDVSEVVTPEKFYDKSLRDLDLRDKYGVQVLAIKNVLREELNINPPPDTQLKPDDILILLGDTESLQKFSK